MLKIGDKPEIFTLPKYGSGNFTLDETSYSGKITLLSFVDIYNGWDWLYYLLKLRAEMNTSVVDIVAILFNSAGGISVTDIDHLFPPPYGSGTEQRFTRAELRGTLGLIPLVDNTWTSSTALAYQAGFSAGYDNSFNGGAGTTLWSFLISKDFYITDKWNTNCTANLDPVSLNRLKLYVSQFNISGTFASGNTARVALDSLGLAGNYIDINYNGTVYTYTVNCPGAAYVTPVNGTTSSSLVPIAIQFNSNTSGADTPANYVLSTTVGSPIAGLAVSSLVYTTSFNSTYFGIVHRYAKERINNLLIAPQIMDIQPVQGLVTGLTQVKITFSKPMGTLDAGGLNITSIKTEANYTFSGGATQSPGSIAFAAINPILYENNGRPSVDPNNVGKIENVVTLNLSASLTDTNPDKTAVVAVTTNITDTQSVPLPPAQRDIVYTYDITPPSFSAFTLTSGTPTRNPDITFNFTVTDNVGVIGWMVNESSTKPLSTDTGWTAVPPITPLVVIGGTYTLSGGLGTKTVYAWAKDAAGNVSAVNANSHFDVVFDSELPQTTAFTRSSVSPTKNPVVSFHLDGSDNFGIVQWIVTETNTKPSPGSSGWTIVATTTSLSINGTYTLTSPSTSRIQTLYVWLGDGAGNVSDENGTSHFDVYFDVTPPIVTAFTLTSPSITNNQTITFVISGNDPF